MAIKKDIQNIGDIRLLVDTFYESVRLDSLIGPVFNEKIGDRWPQHLEKMYSFWQTILLGEHTYSGAPFAPHARLPVSAEHFDRWLHLFFSTLDSLFEGERAKEAKWRAFKMAEMFNAKIEYFRKNDSQFPLA